MFSKHQKKQGIVIGCGHCDQHSLEYHKYKIPHDEIHPISQFDTVDNNSTVKATYQLDIQNVSIIKTTIKNKYNLVVFERIPSMLINEDSAQSSAYLLNNNGMVVMLAAGSPTMYFSQIMKNMKMAGFLSCILLNENLIFFFKEDSNNIANIIKFYQNSVPYVNCLINNQGQLIHSINNKPINYIYYAWKIEDLLKQYTTLIEKQPNCVIHTNNCSFIKSPELKNLIQNETFLIDLNTQFDDNLNHQQKTACMIF